MSNTSIRPGGLDASIPKSWHISALGDLFSQRKEKDRTNLPLLAITGGGGVVLRDSLERRDTSNADKSKYLRVCKGDIAYNTMRMWQGVSGLSNYEGIVSPAYTICKPKEGVSSSYMAQLFKLPQLVQIFHRNSQGLVDDTLNLKFENLAPIQVCVPPLPEQQKIAAILSSVDDVIEKTRAQIDKLKDLKTGMMQELLTKGIGSGGVPHTEFKDSAVGRIPASWAVKTVGDLGAVVTGSTPKTASREYYGGSIPFISPSDINHSMYIRKTANSLTEAGLKETRELPAGTVCVVCIGSTIGKTGITTFRCATNQQVNAVICHGTHPEFVYYLLTYHSKVIKAEAGTQAVPIINKSSFSALPVQLPGYDEQVEIGNSIASVDSQTSFLERKLQSTTSLKKALMQDLLTGKVRVKIDQKESAVS